MFTSLRFYERQNENDITSRFDNFVPELNNIRKYIKQEGNIVGWFTYFEHFYVIKVVICYVLN